MKHTVAWYVKCPYYRCEEKKKLFCEGVQSGTSLHLVFGTIEEFQKYKDRFCKGAWASCPLADMQNRKWNYDTT